MPVRPRWHRRRPVLATRTPPLPPGPGDDPPPPWQPRRTDRPPAFKPAPRRVPARPAPRRDPLPGLAALVPLSLVAAFFAWVSAGPLWLAVGHSTAGTVVIADCTGGGLTQRCRGVFLAEDGRFTAHGVRVAGVPAERTATGTALPARMTGADDDTAYADTGPGRHLRWLLGLLVVAACAAAIVRCTGAARLPDRRSRRWAVAAGLAGPLLITLGFVAAAW
ncbi:hypothetical protein DLJ46_32230 [Micromonospora globispora]|uniref:Uncharacterized protein n=1 Tax=Micromonospora globispora TaxID=1450148 RepID=A0A317JV24_9ACTN|nr:hypothetical protein DLJ46_32230 [Micromonospora globispora]